MRMRSESGWMVVARGDGCQRAPPKTETRPRWPGFRKGVGLSRRGKGHAGDPVEPWSNMGGTMRFLRVPKGGGGWAVPPPLRSLHQRRRSLLVAVWCALGTMSSVAVAAAGRFRGLRAPGWRYRADRRRSVRHSAGALRLSPVRPYRFGRPGRRLGPAAVAANSLPVPFSARGNRREARSGGGTGRHTSTVSAKRLAGGSLAARNVPGRTWGLPSGASPFPLCLHTTDAGGRGGRRNRRVAAASLSRGIRLGLALCEGQRCHALMGN